MTNRKNGNGNGGDDTTTPTISRGRRITADDLSKAAEAARDAANAASNAAEAVVVALESGEVDEALVGMEEGQGSAQKGGAGLPASASGKVAFEEFMAQLHGVLRKAGDQLTVTEHARWVKIESKKNGHKIYVAKGKNQVNRIESTLPPELVPGAVDPDRRNGRIASYIPADPRAVSVAIRRLVQSEDHIRPPLRGGGGGEGGGAGSGGGRPQCEFN